MELRENIKRLVNTNKLSSERAIELEIFLTNTNLSNEEKDKLMYFIEEVSCA